MRRDRQIPDLPTRTGQLLTAKEFSRDPLLRVVGAHILYYTCPHDMCPMTGVADARHSTLWVALLLKTAIAPPPFPATPASGSFHRCACTS